MNKNKIAITICKNKKKFEKKNIFINEFKSSLSYFYIIHLLIKLKNINFQNIFD